MYKKNKIKAIVAIAVALAFIMPGAASFANVGTIGVTSDSENTDPQPLGTHYFYGAVSIDGVPAPIGTEVRVDGTGVTHSPGVNPLITTQVGFYGIPDPKLKVYGRGIPEGTILTFFINDEDTGQTYVYVNGATTSFDLKIGEPYTPSNPNPTDGEINVAIDVGELSWTGGHSNTSQLVTYDVYFGDTSPPSQVEWNQSGTTYDLGALEYSTNYYWQIVAWDTQGFSTNGPIWNFTTIGLPTWFYVDDDNPDSEWYNRTQVRTIQEGVNNATIGDIIYVFNGTYHEHVTVTKWLSFIGESREGVIVDGSGTGNVFYATTPDKVSIDTFTITNGENGIYFYQSSYNDVRNCIVYNNAQKGIYIRYSSNNNIINCNVYGNNGYGIYIYTSSRDNLVYHNNVVNNAAGNAYDYDYPTTDINQWDNGYSEPFNPVTDGGNYWGDYTGVDDYSGPGQDEEGSDGIGDTPYNVSSRTPPRQDRYPLMDLWGDDIIPPTITDVMATPDTQVTGEHVNITANVTDGVDTVKVNITYPDSSTVEVMMNEGSYYYNVSYSSIGTYDYFIWANDTIGNEAMSSIYQFEITDFYYDLTIDVVGEGTTTPSEGVHSYLNCTVVDLTALPNYGWEFANWSGDITTTDNPTNITMDSDKAVTATFTQIPAKTIYVDDDADPGGNGTYEHPYQHIQDGIDNALAGDTIYVYNGTYHEHVTVTIRLRFIGESREGVIVDGSGTGNVFYVTASGVSIDTFTITNGKYGIYLESSSNCNIINCDVHNNGEIADISYGYGIYLDGSPDNSITNCDCYNNGGSGIYYTFGYGIYLESSSGNSIGNCEIYDNPLGITFYESPNNILRDNNLFDNDVHLDIGTTWYHIAADFYEDIDETNMVNGKPVYYHIGDNNAEVTGNFGFIGLINCVNMTVRDLDVCAVVVVDSINSTISNVTVHGRVTREGIYVLDSQNTNLTSCNSYNHLVGIWIQNSPYTQVADSNFYDDTGAANGINDYDSPYTTFTNCTIHDVNSYGLSLISSYNTFTDCEFYNCSSGIHIYPDGNNNNFINTSSHNNGDYGINADRCHHTTLVDCSFYDNPDAGILFQGAEDVTITNCTVDNNTQHGIYLDDDVNCVLRDNTLTNNGLTVTDSYDHYIDATNTIDGKRIYYLVDQGNMTLDGTEYAFAYLALIRCTNITAKNADVMTVMIIRTDNITLDNITSHDTAYGIYGYRCPDTTITNCTTYDNVFQGIYLERAWHQGDIYSGSTITNCKSYDNGFSNFWIRDTFYTNITDCISDNNGVNYGIRLGVAYCNIVNCTVSNSPGIGIKLQGGRENTFTDCTSHDNDGYGFYLEYLSYSNNLINCESYNNSDGLNLWQAKDNSITNCNFHDNREDGVHIRDTYSRDNIFHHNNFVNNAQNAFEDGCGSNTWDDGIGEGNYWDDYEEKYPDANEIGNSGIWDTPYVIPDGSSQDNYPLMVPLGDDITPPEITDVMATPDMQITSGYVNITATVTDDFRVDTVKVNITYPDSSTVNVTMSEGSYYYNTTYAENGIYNYFIWANDTIGNEAMSSTYQFEITELEPIPPVITDILLTPSYPMDTDPLYGWEKVTCTVTDNVEVRDVKLFVTDPNSYTESFPMIKDGDTYSYNTTFTIVGDYTYYIWADDTSDNIATTETTPETFTLYPNWDVNKDGKIRLKDFVCVAGHYGEDGPYGWIREDVNNDGKIRLKDFVVIAGHYGEGE